MVFEKYIVMLVWVNIAYLKIRDSQIGKNISGCVQ